MEKKCKYCAMMIPKEASICPHCRKKQGTSTGVKILAVIFVLIGIGMCNSLMSNKDTHRSAGLKTDSITNEPVLELQTWHWGESYSHVIAEGSIKNVSSESLKNVTAVVQYYDKEGTFITSSEALIDYNPIMPGQVSPFKTITTANPAMKRANINFKSLMGGTLNFIEKPKKVKKIKS